MIILTKKEARTEFSAKRLALDALETERRSAGILLSVQKLDWAKFTMVHAFLPIREVNEPDTYRIIEWLRVSHPDIRIVISKSDLETYTMRHFIWDEQTVLSVNRWGVPEPQAGIEIAPGQLDLVFVPLLAVDKQGQRVGYGKGFYDRFLHECRTDVYTVGLSFFEPVDRISDTALTDIPINMCVTPGRIHYFK